MVLCLDIDESCHCTVKGRRLGCASESRPTSFWPNRRKADEQSWNCSSAAVASFRSDPRVRVRMIGQRG